MDGFLSEILTVSIQGGIVILAVMALRLMLKKAPKSTICLLWLLAGLRLLIPIQIESSFSLQPDQDVLTQLEWSAAGQADTSARGEILDSNGEVLVQREPSVPGEDAAQGWGEVLDSDGEVLARQELSGAWEDADKARGEILDKNGEVLVGKPAAQAPASVSRENVFLLIWLAGVAAMGIYTAVSYWQLKRKVADAVILEEGVWVSNRIDSPFLLGFLHPKIYLPLGLTEWARPYVLAHERAHLARRDHIWKLLGFVALALHWFNPLVWVGYVLLCRDLEMACDEAVVKTMDIKCRKAYSSALLSCSAGHHTIAACPVAFAEVSVKDRIRNVLNYKKPGFWIMALAAAAIIFVAVFFLTSPGEQMEEVLRAGYQGPGEAYEYYHSEAREKAWEEDILYMAECLLTEHPYVTDDDFFIYRGIDLQEVEMSRALYDPYLREDVISHVDKLIPRLAELTDDQILCEMQRIMALLNDTWTNLNLDWNTQEKILCSLEPIYENGGVSLYAVRMDKEYENLIFGKLAAMNGVPVEEVMERIKPYISCENDSWAIQQQTSHFSNMLLCQKGVLQTVGIVGLNDDSVELTFETERGTETAVLPFLTTEAYRAAEKANYRLANTNQVQYQWLGEKWYWYEVLEEDNVLYMHIQCIADNWNLGYYFDRFLVEATAALQNAEEPMRVVIDFRYAGGKFECLDEVNSFIGRVNRYGNDGVYIIVDGSTFGCGSLTAYRMAEGIEGAKLVGSPTGTGVNFMTDAYEHTLPNSGAAFFVNTEYRMADPDSSAATLTPDILVYQTLEDYKNGVDTVFEAAVHGDSEQTEPSDAGLSEEELAWAAENVQEIMESARVTSIGANRVLIQDCVEALEKLQSRSSIHLTATATFEGVPGETGSYQEYWLSGDGWMRIGEQYFADTAENYTVGNLCLDGIQYRFGHAGAYDSAERLWTEARDDQLWHEYWLLDFDLSAARVLSLEKWDTEDGYAVRMVLGRQTDTAVYGTDYVRTHTYYLDKEGNLLRLVENAVYQPLVSGAIKTDTRIIQADICILETPEAEIVSKLENAESEAVK